MSEEIKELKMDELDKVSGGFDRVTEGSGWAVVGGEAEILRLCAIS